eukprot:TRINITY_DN13108_c0_g1_i2.p1 TRINITY_DN13108_c0_g1~~TRINITY_DN13108_c0_g1_i2.p1  ORF type:complete len:379 (+),score=98.90 TRINITY_DN13108_c0_g1_i2:73-1209(+)
MCIRDRYTPSMTEVESKEEEVFSAQADSSGEFSHFVLEENSEELNRSSAELKTSREEGDYFSSKRLIESYNTPQFTMRSQKKDSKSKLKTIQCELIETDHKANFNKKENVPKIMAKLKGTGKQKSKAIELHFEDTDESFTAKEIKDKTISAPKQMEKMNYLRENKEHSKLMLESKLEEMIEESPNIKQSSNSTQDNIISSIAATIEKSHEIVSPSYESTLNTFSEISRFANSELPFNFTATQHTDTSTPPSSVDKRKDRNTTGMHHLLKEKGELAGSLSRSNFYKQMLIVNTPKQTNNENVIRSMLVDTLSTKNREETALFVDSINAVSDPEDKQSSKRMRQKVEAKPKPEAANCAIKRFLKGIINDAGRAKTPSVKK